MTVDTLIAAVFSHIAEGDTEYKSGGLRDFFLCCDLGVAADAVEIAAGDLQVSQVLGYISDIVAMVCIHGVGRPVVCPERPFSWLATGWTPGGRDRVVDSAAIRACPLHASVL